MWRLEYGSSDQAGWSENVGWLQGPRAVQSCRAPAARTCRGKAPKFPGGEIRRDRGCMDLRSREQQSELASPSQQCPFSVAFRGSSTTRSNTLRVLLPSQTYAGPSDGSQSGSLPGLVRVILLPLALTCCSLLARGRATDCVAGDQGH